MCVCVCMSVCFYSEGFSAFPIANPWPGETKSVAAQHCVVVAIVKFVGGDDGLSVSQIVSELSTRRSTIDDVIRA